MRGRGVPRERLLEVAEHYQHFGGVSPINEQNRALLAAIRAELDLPVYWGNRNWHPTGRGHRRDHARRRGPAGAGVRHQRRTASYSALPAVPGRHRPGPGRRSGTARRSWTSCGTTSTTRGSSSRTPTRCGPRWLGPTGRRRLVFTAHSIPVSMEAPSGPGGHLYTAQLRETARLVAEAVRGPGAEFDLVWQSRSGPPQVPWLEPDVNDHLAALAAAGVRPRSWSAPIGFVSDHLEVLWDLDDGGGRDRGRARAGLRPGGDRRHRPAVRPDGPRAGRGAHRRGAEAGPRPDGPQPRRLPAGLLPGPAPPALTAPSTVAVHGGRGLSGAGRARRCRRPGGPGGRRSRVDGERRRGRGPRRR